MIKGLRKSFKDKKSSHSSISSPLNDKTGSISSLNDIQISNHNILQSPKRVIKALYDYKPQGPGELEFSKGDFFHVIGNEDDPEWYEACNPSKNVRGMVPVPYFEVFGKSRPNTTGTTSSSQLTTPPSAKKLSSDSYSNSVTSRSSQSGGGGANTLYGVVLYDFRAERSDELDIHTGESIILCAHHNYEWFIAKPIDRLGGPGLVPVSYVGVINILTGNSTGNDVADDINNAGLPTVEEWKGKNAKYKASSIPLGNVDENETKQEFRSSRITSNSTTRHHSESNFNHGHFSTGYNYAQLETTVDDSTPAIIEAVVDSFHVDNGRYWFHVRALLNNGEVRSLCRYYEDFYEFQIKLLELYPNEAGRSSEQKRILPFIPGPLTYITDKITKKRQIDLNDYVQELVALPNYISHSRFVKNLFEVRHELDHILDHIQPDAIEQGGDDTLIKEESMKTLNQHNQQPQQPQQSSSTGSASSVKLKFFYKDDIFALLIPSNIELEDLKEKIRKRIYDDDNYDTDFSLYIKDGSNTPILNSDDIIHVLENKLKILIDDE